MGGIQQYCLRWNNHRSNLLLVFEHLFLTESFTDVTLACDGSSIKCHKMVLAACSSYFQQLLMENDCRHPIVILKDIKFSEMKAILEYMYKGEVNVAQDQLAGLLKAAETLKVKGLVEDKPNVSSGSATPAPPTRTPPTRTPPTRTPTTPTPPTPGADQNQSTYQQPPPKNSTPFHMWSYSLPLAPSPKQIHHGSNNNFENSQNQPVNFTNKLEANKDTPILRTVLGHTLQYQNSIDNPPSNQHRERDRHTSDSLPLDNDKVNEENSSLSTEEAKSGIATYVPEQKPEWKRYKQYTRNDIMAAIEAVKTGMSALQAARKYGVPSRTLYDKVKKLGINTNRPYRKGSFPMSPYQGIGIKGEEALNYVKSQSEDDASYSPADISLDISYTGNGTEMDSDRMDSDAACSVKQEHSPPMDDEKDVSMDDEKEEGAERTNHVHHKHIENGSSVNNSVNQSLLI